MQRISHNITQYVELYYHYENKFVHTRTGTVHANTTEAHHVMLVHKIKQHCKESEEWTYKMVIESIITTTFDYVSYVNSANQMSSATIVVHILLLICNLRTQRAQLM